MMTCPELSLVPAPVQILGHGPKLDDEVAGQVLRLDLTPLLPPQPHQGDFVVAHDDPGVGAAYKSASIGGLCIPLKMVRHDALLRKNVIP